MFQLPTHLYTKTLSSLKSRMKASSCAWTCRFVSSFCANEGSYTWVEKTDWRSIVKEDEEMYE